MELITFLMGLILGYIISLFKVQVIRISAEDLKEMQEQLKNDENE